MWFQKKVLREIVIFRMQVEENGCYASFLIYPWWSTKQLSREKKKKLNAKCTIFPELGYSLIAKFHVKEVYV